MFRPAGLFLAHILCLTETGFVGSEPVTIIPLWYLEILEKFEGVMRYLSG